MKKEHKDDGIPFLPPELLLPVNTMNPMGLNVIGLVPFGIDPLGSYTGVTEDIFEEPVQDADDL